MVPSVVYYYRITAAGVDKIEGDSEYTAPSVHGINISATGQNIITVGDGNHVDARFESIAKALVEFEKAIAAAPDLNDATKWQLVHQSKTIENQLATVTPNPTILAQVWQAIERLTTGTSLAADVATLFPLLSPLLQ